MNNLFVVQIIRNIISVQPDFLLSCTLSSFEWRSPQSQTLLRSWQPVDDKKLINFDVLSRDGPDGSFAGYPAILKIGFPAGYPVGAGYRISGRIYCRIPDISDIDRVTQIIETSQIFKQE